MAVVYPDPTERDTISCEPYITIGTHQGKCTIASLMGTGRDNTDTAANESDVSVNTDPDSCMQKFEPCQSETACTGIRGGPQFDIFAGIHARLCKSTGPDGPSNHHVGCNVARDSFPEEVPICYTQRNLQKGVFHATDNDVDSSICTNQGDTADGTITLVGGPPGL